MLKLTVLSFSLVQEQNIPSNNEAIHAFIVRIPFASVYHVGEITTLVERVSKRHVHPATDLDCNFDRKRLFIG